MMALGRAPPHHQGSDHICFAENELDQATSGFPQRNHQVGLIDAPEREWAADGDDDDLSAVG
jgi:hypothetical protein